MQYGYSLPDGTKLDIKFKPIYTYESYEKFTTSLKIHDINGKPYLLPNERILMEFKGPLQLIDNQAEMGETLVFLPAEGEGVFYLTNKRIIGHRFPKVWKRSLTTRIQALFEKEKLKNFEKDKIRQYFELPISEIIQVETKNSVVYYLSNFKIGIIVIPNEIIEQLIVINKNIEVEVNTIKKGEKSFKIIHYDDPGILKNEKNYIKRNKWVKKAKEYESIGNFMGALNLYKKAFKLFPEDEFSKNKIDKLSK